MKIGLRSTMLVCLLLAACTPGAATGPSGPTAGPNIDVPTLPVETPIPQPINNVPVEQPQLTGFEMLNEIDGWGLTDSSVLRTNDGGTSWYNVTPSGSLALGFGAGSSILDTGRAFLVVPDASDPMNAGTLYRTEDGGKTWTSNPIPFGSCQLRFFDMQKGWAMVSLGVAAGSNAIGVFQTTDGGKTWNQSFINDPTAQGASDEIPLGGLKGVFLPLNMQTAWVGGVVYSSATVYLFRTGDGGHSWKQVDLELPEGSREAQLSIESIQFVTPSDGFLSMQVTGQTIRRALYITEDAGEHWKLAPALVPNARATDFVSPTDGFMFSGEGFQVTHDAGQTWMLTKPDVAFSDTFMGMDFVNPTTGWVTASDPTTFEISVYKTTDGGRTWIPQ